MSGQAFKKGFFWYDDPARKTEEEIMETTPPLSSSPQSVQEEKIELNSKWLKDNMPRLLTQAMDNQTPENLSRFYTAQRLGNDSNLLIVFYVQIMPDDFVMQLHRF
ncbi:conjugal transfer protein TraF [Escherichia coli]|uniref:conjugal transfer protein TraF n=1 Tax=Escherichia coli TaxID=562 RepID=UPI00313B563A